MSECKHKGFYSNVHCSGCDQYAPETIAKLQAENARLQEAAQKAFWAGYEDARLNPHLSNIRKAWERYNAAIV